MLISEQNNRHSLLQFHYFYCCCALTVSIYMQSTALIPVLRSLACMTSIIQCSSWESHFPVLYSSAQCIVQHAHEVLVHCAYYMCMYLRATLTINCISWITLSKYVTYKYTICTHHMYTNITAWMFGAVEVFHAWWEVVCASAWGPWSCRVRLVGSPELINDSACMRSAVLRT